MIKRKNEICWPHYEGIIRVLGKACLEGMIYGKKTGEDKEEHWETMLRNGAGGRALGELNDILRIGMVGGSW